MAVGTALAIYFVVWWIVLFAMLPIGMPAQEDDRLAMTSATPKSPARSHFIRATWRTTLVSAVLFGGFYFVFVTLGYSFADLPLMVPEQFQKNG